MPDQPSPVPPPREPTLADLHQKLSAIDQRLAATQRQVRTGLSFFWPALTAVLVGNLIWFWLSSFFTR